MLNQGNQKLLKQNQQLEDAVRFGAQAEIEARDIKLDLEGQSNQLENVGGNIGRLGGHLAAGSKLIDVMRRHETKNKLILL